MKSKLNIVKIVIITIVFIGLLGSEKAISENSIGDKSDISLTKPWTVTLSAEVDKNSINSNTVKVIDESGKSVAATITLATDNKTIVIDPPIDGYIPSSSYYVVIDETLKSIDGTSLDGTVKMKFITKNSVEDFTNYSELPSINSFKTEQDTLINNSKIDFKITSNTNDNVQYRVFVYKYTNDFYDVTYKYSNVNYTEITSGYSSAIKGSSIYTLTKNSGLSSGRYKVMVYVRKANNQGQHNNTYTDYDNFYSGYIKVLDSSIISNKKANETIKTDNYSKTLDEMVTNQITNGAPVTSTGSSWIKPSAAILKFYINPNNFMDDYGKYIFMDLRYMDGVTVDDLNKLLVGKGILEGKGQAFLDAALAKNINPIYLVSHCLLETGNGTSSLAKGIEVSEVNGLQVEKKITYNLFGIKATDSNPNKYGSEYAYTQGWFSIEDAILGGAEYIGSGYINSSKYNQNTLYEMRYNVNVSWHQYSSDVAWAYKQIKNIKSLIEACKNAQPIFEIPIYK
ncbi:glucosaminidase domain-containing protein [Clostridium grantii]|uniref:Mannosyl-glycoprotein endo-beta-N-acetylglucosaminidase n=1 Tax=Clostridium grantii DSM 8605 TaxID=1121316 RepID=A0A1M5XIN3_9CLOT|nr:glucosaminidase domain-containing protein [Clostridium grantii]SHH99616.1 mannosyl-glycoprotein endo-beta-N-acetylglucosaminidase [Clostridium grantii DSM 8605]